MTLLIITYIIVIFNASLTSVPLIYYLLKYMLASVSLYIMLVSLNNKLL
jgi:hypothetical protein